MNSTPPAQPDAPGIDGAVSWSSQPADVNSSLLLVRNLGVSFGGLRAVQQFSLSLPAAGLCGLIGPNGAGKSTVFNLLTGMNTPDAGEISLAGISLCGVAPHRIAAAGIARTFQNIRLLPDLSVLDNVRVAAQLRCTGSLMSALLRTPAHHHCEQTLKNRAITLLEMFDLQKRAAEPARSLSYGHQRKLEIVRALATSPRVLLLDEPAAGLNSQEKKGLAESIREIRSRFQVAILLIDHDMGLVMNLCEQIVVLDHGLTICRGTPALIQHDTAVIAAYLGAAARPGTPTGRGLAHFPAKDEQGVGGRL